jgi:hypothetical protein
VKPKRDKIDLQRLKQDIPKFQALSGGDRQWWQKFLEDFESSLSSSSDTCAAETWQFDELQKISENNPRVETIVEHASERLRNLHDSTKQPGKVCNLLLSITYCKY